MSDDIFAKAEQALREEERQVLLANKNLIVYIKSLAATSGLQLTDECFQYGMKSGLTVTYPNIVSYLCPDLIRDKEGLLDFAKLCADFERKRFTPGLLHGQDFILLASKYFRRSFHPQNHFAPRFIELFWSMRHQGIQPFITIDFDRVRIDKVEFGPMELDHWYGPKYSREISDISDGVVKLCPPRDLEDHQIDFVFKSAYSLDIVWNTKDGIKSFQAEEFKTENVTIELHGTVYHPVRYLHAEFDISTGVFRHFDGAIHFYTPQEYFQRRDSDFNYKFKSANQIKTLSEKQFKINGSVSVDMWREFTSHFLFGNPLIFEYFEGQYPREIHEILDRIRVVRETGNGN